MYSVSGQVQAEAKDNFAKDSYDSYLRDMASAVPMTRDEETRAFRAKEDLEMAFIRAVVESPPFRKAAESVLSGAESGDAAELLRRSLDLGPDEAASAIASGIRGTDGMVDLIDDLHVRLLESGLSGRHRRRVRSSFIRLQAAKGAIVVANLRLVVYMVRTYRNVGMGLTVSDLVQEGNIGLMKAVDKFDWRRETRFSTYASWWIRQGMRRALSDKDRIVRVPVHVSDKAYRAKRMEQVLHAKTGLHASREDIARELGVSDEKAGVIRSVMDSVVYSLDAPAGPDDSPSWVEFIPDGSEESPFDRAFDQELESRVKELLGCLTPMERRIVRWRFGLDRGSDVLTLQEIADKYGLSRERIRQLESRALKKMRAPARAFREALMR